MPPPTCWARSPPERRAALAGWWASRWAPASARPLPWMATWCGRAPVCRRRRNLELSLTRAESSKTRSPPAPSSRATAKRTGQEREVAAIAASAANDPVAAEVFTEIRPQPGRGAARRALHVRSPGDRAGRRHRAFGESLSGRSPGRSSEICAELRVSALGDHAPLVGAGAAWFERNAVPATAQTAATNAGPGRNNKAPRPSLRSLWHGWEASKAQFNDPLNRPRIGSVGCD